MDGSFREQGSGTQQAPKSFLAGLRVLTALIQWLAGLVMLTEEEQEEAGIHYGRPGGDETPDDSLRTSHTGRK